MSTTPAAPLSGSQRFLIRSVSIIVLGLFINQLLQTAGSIVLARLLHDPVAFGEVNLLLQIFGMVTLFLNVGFNSSLVYTFSTNTEEAIHVKFRLAMAGSVFFAVVVSLLLIALAPVLAKAYGIPGLRGALTISAATLLFQSVIHIGVASFSGNREFRTQAFFMVVMTLCSTAGMVAGALYPLGGYLWGVSLWSCVGAACTAVFVCWRVDRVHRPRWRGALSPRLMREMMGYGVPMWAGNIAKAFQQPFLVMMIGSISVVAVGELANASRITGFVGIITWAFMIVTLPFVAESVRDPAESRRRGTLCIRYNNLTLYPLTAVICLFPDEINSFLFGTGYTSADSGTYIRLLALGVFFSSVGRLGGNILAGVGRTKANFWVMIAAGLPVIVFVPLLVGKSPVWAVWVYTGSWAASAAAMIGFFYREGFPLDWWRAYGQPLIPTAAMCVVLGVGRWAGVPLPLFAALAAACLLGLTLRMETKGWPLPKLRYHR
ncbi:MULTISPECIES: oligosaccharide flippase family protein [Paenibacillus]|uniref:oligosaccharide flippase family protein n=1 Tax=Paenibacillus TaxID=44249 RepID=UPI0022B8B4A6|nr:oligosaccharide flippase family protein [Paenibacillus caseinilyticus]MCZ8520931.1 oligosaccharide flippase family protein [Paenibacillus caseinilyticus]